MKSAPRYTVDHEVRFASNRDGVSLAASVFLPADWSATVLEKSNNDPHFESRRLETNAAASSPRDEEKHGVVRAQRAEERPAERYQPKTMDMLEFCRTGGRVPEHMKTAKPDPGADDVVELSDD